jgi:hypothetical protein
MLIKKFEAPGGIARALSVFCVFSFMFDSGGELGIRAAGFALLLITLLLRFKHVKLHANEIYGWLGFICLLMPSILIASLNGIELSKIATWVVIFFIFPFFILAVRAARINETHFIHGGLFFAIIILTIFIGRIFQIGPILEFHYFISERTAGFFNEKAAYSDEAMPVVYFQGTLTLVICAALAVANQRKLIYLVITLALIAAPSRVGAFAALTVGLFIFFMRQTLVDRRSLVFFAIAMCLFALGYFALSNDQASLLLATNEGPSTRQLHLESVARQFSDHPLFFVFGNGPGSEFYSSGIEKMTDNIEISQLEMLRKFGIVFSFFLIVAYVWIIRRLINARQTPLYLAMVAHFFVAASNPVLFSIPAIIIFAMAIVRLQEIEPQNCGRTLIINH